MVHHRRLSQPPRATGSPGSRDRQRERRSSTCEARRLRPTITGSTAAHAVPLLRSASTAQWPSETDTCRSAISVCDTGHLAAKCPVSQTGETGHTRGGSTDRPGTLGPHNTQRHIACIPSLVVTAIGL